MKLSKLLAPQFQASLLKLMGQDQPLLVAAKLKKIAKIRDNEYANYEKVRVEVVTKYGKKKEDGTLEVDQNNLASFSEEDGKLAREEFNRLLDAEVEVPTLKISDLSESCVASTGDLMNLEDVLLD